MSTRNTVHFTTRSSELAAAASTAFTFSRAWCVRSEEHTSELQSRSDLVCRLLLEKKKKKNHIQRRRNDHTTHHHAAAKMNNRISVQTRAEHGRLHGAAALNHPHRLSDRRTDPIRL